MPRCFMPKKQHQKLSRSTNSRRSPSPASNSAGDDDDDHQQQQQQQRQQQDDEDKRAIAISAKMEASNVYRPPTPVNHSVTTTTVASGKSFSLSLDLLRLILHCERLLMYTSTAQSLRVVFFLFSVCCSHAHAQCRLETDSYDHLTLQ